MITEEKKKRRRSVIRQDYPNWYPWVSFGLRDAQDMPAPAPMPEGGSGEGGGGISEDASIFQAPNYSKSLMVPRQNMPQIKSDDIEDFMASLGMGLKEISLDPNKLAPTQGQFDMDKVAGMAPEAARKPVLVSTDGYVLDGHHRWLRNARDGLSQPAYRVPLEAKAALAKMNAYGKSFNKGINEDWYHGSASSFKEIDQRKMSTGFDRLGPGFYMTDSAPDANMYAKGDHRQLDPAKKTYPNVLKLQHNVQNPIDVDRQDSLKDEHVLTLLKDHAGMDDTQAKEHLELSKNPPDTQDGSVSRFLNTPIVNQINYLHRTVFGKRTTEFLDALHKVTGHDGMITNRPRNTPTGNPQTHVAAWFPKTQVKMKWAPNKAGSEGLMESYDDYFDHIDMSNQHRELNAAQAATLSKPHQDAINFFSTGSKDIRKTLAGRKDSWQAGKVPDQFGIHQHEKVSSDLMGAIEHFGELKAPIRVFSGMSRHTNPEAIHKFSNGLFHHPGFISSSTHLDVAHNFASKNDADSVKHVVMFDLPAGSKHGAFIGGVSANPDEHEFLIGHDKMLAIHGKVGEHQDGSGNPVHVWQGEIIDNPERSTELAGDNHMAHNEIQSHRQANAKDFKGLIGESDEPVQTPVKSNLMESAWNDIRETLAYNLKRKFLTD